jgi:hypothetical protein
LRDRGDAIAEEFCGEVSHWRFLFCIKGFRFTPDALFCQFSKSVIAKTLTMGLQQFLNIVVINILQSRFIGQFDDFWVTDSSTPTEFLHASGHSFFHTPFMQFSQERCNETALNGVALSGV